jgi:hypothetical protein
LACMNACSTRRDDATTIDLTERKGRGGACPWRRRTCSVPATASTSGPGSSPPPCRPWKKRRGTSSRTPWASGSRLASWFATSAEKNRACLPVVMPPRRKVSVLLLSFTNRVVYKVRFLETVVYGRNSTDLFVLRLHQNSEMTFQSFLYAQTMK